jgi:hypothetical protein
VNRVFAKWKIGDITGMSHEITPEMNNRSSPEAQAIIRLCRRALVILMPARETTGEVEEQTWRAAGAFQVRTIVDPDRTIRLAARTVCLGCRPSNPRRTTGEPASESTLRASSWPGKRVPSSTSMDLSPFPLATICWRDGSEPPSNGERFSAAIVKLAEQLFKESSSSR